MQIMDCQSYSCGEAERSFSEIRSGDLLGFAGRGFWSSLIRWRTLSRITHVGFAFWFGKRLAVIEARERRGVRLFPLQRYLEKGVAVHWYELLDDDYRVDRHRLIEEALAHWGQRYASPLQFLRSFGVATRRLCDWLQLPADTNPRRFFCSEFVQHCLQQAGYAGTSLPPSQTAPADVVWLPCFQRRGQLQADGRLVV